MSVSYTHLDVYKRQAYTTYGTNRVNAYKILEDSLNLRDVRIYDTIEDADGKERRVLNAKESAEILRYLQAASFPLFRKKAFPAAGNKTPERQN